MDKYTKNYRAGMLSELEDLLKQLSDGMLEKVLAYARVAYEKERRSYR